VNDNNFSIFCQDEFLFFLANVFFFLFLLGDRFAFCDGLH
jgi:hypothetical protein